MKYIINSVKQCNYSEINIGLIISIVTKQIQVPLNLIEIY